MASISRKRDELIEDLEDQISGLRKEIVSLRKSVSRRGAGAYDEAADFFTELYEQLWKQSRGAGRGIVRHARNAGDTARDNPVATTVVGLVVIGLLASLLVRR